MRQQVNTWNKKCLFPTGGDRDVQRKNFADSFPPTLSTLQSNTQILNDVPQREAKTATTTRMAPSSTSLSASIAAAEANADTSSQPI
jgi:hypothetical protein